MYTKTSPSHSFTIFPYLSPFHKILYDLDFHHRIYLCIFLVTNSNNCSALYDFDMM